MALTAPCVTWDYHRTGIKRQNVFAIESANIPPRPVDLIEAGTLEKLVREQVMAVAEKK